MPLALRPASARWISNSAGNRGRVSRQAIAAREARLAVRLRAVEHLYRTALDHDEALTANQHTRALRVTDHIHDWEMGPD
jgi:hypothetical protein